MTAGWRGVPRKLVALGRGVFQREQGSFLAGTAVVQFLPFVTAPLLVRLYSPVEFGTYALFAAFVAIVSTASALAVHNAILVEPDDAVAAEVATLALGISALTSLLLLAALAAVPAGWTRWALGGEVAPFLPWAALTVALSGIVLTIYTWQIRRAAYPVLARSKVAQGVVMVGLQIALGLADLGTAGLVAANMAGFLAGLATMLPGFVGDLRRLGVGWSHRGKALLMRRHRNLPFFTVPAQLINAIGSQVPELMINKFFGPAVLGQYALANRVVNQPLTFLSTAVQDIFRQKASHELREHGHCRRTFMTFLGFMSVAAVAIIAPLVLIAPPLFALVFGEQWREAAHMTQALALLLAVRFVSSPLSYVWILRGKQFHDLVWQIGLLIVAAGSFVGAHLLLPDASPTLLVFAYSGLTALWYVLCLALSYRFAR